MIEAAVDAHTDGASSPRTGTGTACGSPCTRSTRSASSSTTIDREKITREELLDRIFDDAVSASTRSARPEWGEELTRNLERWIVLQVLDTRWREHLDNMDYMRQGIGLRGYAQKDPLVEYKPRAR